MKLVTILTPTYNRANILGNLYKSLQEQLSYNFDWLIVDDGSADDTEQLASEFMKEEKFSVRYVKKVNGGKHTALNCGIREIETPLTIIVDSDDTLLPHAIQIIEEYYEKYKADESIGVLCFLKCKQDGELVVAFSQDEFVGSYVENRVKNSLPGDMAEVFYTETLKQYPFPEFEGERFLSEDVVWIPMALKYQSVFIRDAIYQCEYLEGGLTANDKPMKFASPLGSMMRGRVLMNRACGIKANIKGAIIYNCYRLDAKKPIPNSVRTENAWQKLLVCATYPLGILFNYKWKK